MERFLYTTGILHNRRRLLISVITCQQERNRLEYCVYKQNTLVHHGKNILKRHQDQTGDDRKIDGAFPWNGFFTQFYGVFTQSTCPYKYQYQTMYTVHKSNRAVETTEGLSILTKKPCLFRSCRIHDWLLLGQVGRQYVMHIGHIEIVSAWLP
jgi:hypothetical protein